MGRAVRDIMTRDVIALDAGMHVDAAARHMRDDGIGDVLVTLRGRLHGIVTDRDIVVRCVATGGDASAMTLQEVCTESPRTLRPDDDVKQAVKMVKDNAVRRLPVVSDDGRPVGMVSLGDLAQQLDGKSALGQISAASPSH